MYSETPFTDWDSFQRNFVLSIWNPFSSLKPTCNEEHIWLSELAQKILQSLQFSSSWRGFSLLWNLCEKWGFGLAYEENTCSWFTLSLLYLTIFQQNSLKILIGDVSYLAHSSPLLNSFSDSFPDSLVLTLYLCILVAKLGLPPELIHLSFITTSTYLPNNTWNSPALSR